MKARTYSIYYVRRDETIGAVVRLKSSTEPPAAPEDAALPTETNIVASTFYGFRFQVQFLDRGDLYKKLGFFKAEEVDSIATAATYPVREFIFSQTNVGARASFVRLITFEIIPVDPSKMVAVYEEAYTCRLACDASLSDRDLAGALYNHRFNFGDEKNAIYYALSRNSIREVRRKNNARVIPQY